MNPPAQPDRRAPGGAPTQPLAVAPWADADPLLPPPQSTRRAGSPTVLDLRDRPVARAHRVGLHRRPGSAAVVLGAADLLVLPFYVLALPEQWRTSAMVWALTVVSWQLRGLYRARLHVSVLDDLPLMARTWVGAALAGALAANHLHGLHASDRLVRTAVAALLLHVGLRALAFALIRLARTRRWVEYRTLVIGGGDVSLKITKTLDAHPEYGLTCVGYVDGDAGPHQGAPTAGWAHVGTVADLPQVVENLAIDTVIVGYGREVDARTTNVLRTSPRIAQVFVVPRFFEVGRRSVFQDHIGAIPVSRLASFVPNRPSWRLKRAFDVAASGVALLVLSPLLAAIAVAVRLDGGPGIIFRQERIGRGGRPFQVLKFRSMRPADERESATQWSIATDSRVSKLGRFLRATSLDELPQLWNIFRGDMTIVGPRPERPHFVRAFSGEHPHYVYRHRVPAGLTGLAQVNGLRGNTSIDDRARFDNFYIENWSLWLDVKVILRTINQVFAKAGA